MNLLYLAKTNAVRPDVTQYLETAEKELKRVSHTVRDVVKICEEAPTICCPRDL